MNWKQQIDKSVWHLQSSRLTILSDTYKESDCIKWWHTKLIYMSWLTFVPYINKFRCMVSEKLRSQSVTCTIHEQIPSYVFREVAFTKCHLYYIYEQILSYGFRGVVFTKCHLYYIYEHILSYGFRGVVFTKCPR